MAGAIPTTGERTTLSASVRSFLDAHPGLLDGRHDLHDERRHQLQVFGFHALPEHLRAPVGRVEFHAVRGLHGTIPIRLFYSSHMRDSLVVGNTDRWPALVYFHGRACTAGSVDEFENGLRLLAERANVIAIGVEHHLAPEHPLAHQLDEYMDVIAWSRAEEGALRGIDPNRILGGGDGAGGKLTAAVALRLRDEAKKPLKAQILLYPDMRSHVPLDTPAVTENRSSDGDGEHLKELPPAAVFTCGFDPLRDVGLGYASKLNKAGNVVFWHHYPDLTHGFLQMAPWSEDAARAVDQVASDMKKMTCEPWSFT